MCAGQGARIADSRDPAPHPYLLDGRRVTIGDLLKAGLLTDQAPLVFHRKKKKETHQAEATTAEGGGIRLPGSDKVFRSPSRAARVAVGYGSFDGWFAWQLQDGPLLDDLRQRLLGQVAEEASSAAEPVQEDAAPRLTATQRHDLLQRSSVPGRRRTTSSRSRSPYANCSAGGAPAAAAA